MKIIIILFLIILIIINYENAELFAQNFGYIESKEKIGMYNNHLILTIKGKEYRVLSGANGCESACFGIYKLVPK